MFKNLKDIEFGRFDDLVPAFLTIALMPLTYSISMGLTFGFISYILIKLVTGRAIEISAVMWIIGLFSALNLFLTILSLLSGIAVLERDL
ncbi:MAG: hypothetical protein U5K69_18175 [Balneolaceae bacterium]|nr:hypothetical protein [Balneolaceae bacterium]